MKIIRSKRKTYELRIMPDGELVVRVPLRTTQAQVDKLLEEKLAWIQAKQALAAGRQQAPVRRYADGESFLYLGKAYKLALVEEAKKALGFKEGFFLRRSAQSQAAELFENWYRLQARKVLSERVTLYARQHGFTPGPLRISSARTRWGSCGARGTLNFTWRLVMAPLAVIDYVVIHELAHLKERNHSRRFWEMVEQLMPSYRQQRDWLKAQGHTLKL